MTKTLPTRRSAIDAKKEGDLEVCFLVDAKGNVREPKISRKLSPELDAAALEACKKMPRWETGEKVGGKKFQSCKLQFLYIFN